MKNIQAPSTVVMVRPHHFKPNPETSADNAYQVQPSIVLDTKTTANKAFKEVTLMADKLQYLGVNVHLFDDKTKDTPDSVFPNNWFSAHSDGRVYLYPMYAKNRRLERRKDILELLHNHFRLDKIIDLSEWEQKQQYLEGTGVLVIDHKNKLAYIARSKRADINPINDFCQRQGITPILFSAHDNKGSAVYHTNVLMCVTTDFVIVGDEMIRNQQERKKVRSTINKSNKVLISLTEEQVNRFAGNMIELTGHNGRFIAISQTAYDSLTKKQKQLITSKVSLQIFNIPTIELAGGSVRCMLAGIHLPKQRVRLVS